MTEKTNRGWQYAKEIFAKFDVDAQAAIDRALAIPISVHCWQGDDIGGFEKPADAGAAADGSYPGRARTPEELRADFDQVLAYLPGTTRINIHALYAEPVNGKYVDRDAVTFDNFATWVDWANERNMGIDFNPTFFGHPKAADGCPLTNRDDGIRDFWVEHGRRCREIAARIGEKTGSSVLNNFWTPDGYKDTPADRFAPRKRLKNSFDRMFEKTFSEKLTVDSLECKLYGPGAESFMAGSNEFYLGYAVSRGKIICFDGGHFHPTEEIAEKLSSVLLFLPEVALHVSRPVRWSSDHVVILDDILKSIAYEIVWSGDPSRVRIGLDYFDSTINRVAAWTIGARNMRKALLMAALTPVPILREAENEGDYTTRLALQEEFRMLPYSIAWDQACAQTETGVGTEWYTACKDYENRVLAKR